MWREGGEASSPSSAQGCGSKKAPIFLFFPSSSPRNGTTHGGAPSEGKKLRHLLAVRGGGERRGGERDSAAPQHGAISRKSLLRLVRRRGKGGERKYKASACARIVRDTEESAAAMAAFPLACVRHTRPSEEWHRSSHRGGRLRREVGTSPLAHRATGRREGVVAGSARPVVFFFFRHPYTRLYSFKFSCRMVSFTAANTNRMFSVSVAHVK